jgi:hypothetical protein
MQNLRFHFENFNSKLRMLGVKKILLLLLLVFTITASVLALTSQFTNFDIAKKAAYTCLELPDQTTCNAVLGCNWTGGTTFNCSQSNPSSCPTQCIYTPAQTGSCSDFDNNQTACDDTTGCNWKTTTCTVSNCNQNKCNYNPGTPATCKGTSTGGTCGPTSGCLGFDNSAECKLNNCTWTSAPTCSSRNTSSTCNAVSGCYWSSGTPTTCTGSWNSCDGTYAKFPATCTGTYQTGGVCTGTPFQSSPQPSPTPPNPGGIGGSTPPTATYEDITGKIDIAGQNPCSLQPGAGSEETCGILIRSFVVIPSELLTRYYVDLEEYPYDPITGFRTGERRVVLSNVQPGAYHSYTARVNQAGSDYFLTIKEFGTSWYFENPIGLAQLSAQPTFLGVSGDITIIGPNPCVLNTITNTCSVSFTWKGQKPSRAGTISLNIIGQTVEGAISERVVGEGGNKVYILPKEDGYIYASLEYSELNKNVVVLDSARMWSVPGPSP